MADITLQSVIDGIRTAEAAKVSNPFVANRYPYTYGLDYLRSHWFHFGVNNGMSRSEASGVLRNLPDKEAIYVALADAYLREWGITKEACIPHEVVGFPTVRVYVYVTAPTETIHLVRMVNFSRTLCGRDVDSWPIGDETLSGVSATCGRCLATVRKEA